VKAEPTDIRAELEAAARRAILLGSLAAIAPVSVVLPLLLGIHGYGLEQSLAAVGAVVVLFGLFSPFNYVRLRRENEPLRQCLELAQAGRQIPEDILDQALQTSRGAVRKFQIISTAGWLIGMATGLWMFSTQGDLTPFSTTVFVGCFASSYLFAHGLSWTIYKRTMGPLLGRFASLLSDEQAEALAPLTLRGKILIGLAVGLGIFGFSFVSLVTYFRRAELGQIALSSLRPAARKEAARLAAGEDAKTGPYRELWPRSVWTRLDRAGNPEDPKAWEGLDRRLREAILKTPGEQTFINPLFEQVAVTATLPDGGRIVAAIDRNDLGNEFGFPLTAVAIVLVVLTSVGFQGIMVVKDITGPLEELKKSAARLAAGDLRNPDKPYADDEIGALLIEFGRAARKLSRAIDDSQQLAQSVASATEELASTAVTLVSWSEQVRNDSTRAGEMLSRIASGSQDVDSVMKSTRTEASRASEKAGAGEEDLVTSARGMNQLGQSLGEVFRGIEDLSSRSERIAGIVDVIREITAQTNLLSLNAAIEAARAGEHGRGFGVVADEIRKLADRANISATEINDIVKQVTDTSLKTSALVQAARQDFSSRQQAVGDTASRFHEITVAFSEAERAFEKLEHLSAEHAKLSSESAAALQNIVQTQAEQTTAAEQLRATATELTRMSENLSRQLQTFRLDMTNRS